MLADRYVPPVPGDTRVNCIAPGFVPTHFADFLTKNAAIKSFPISCHPSFSMKYWRLLSTFPVIRRTFPVCVQRKTIEDQSLLKRLGTTEDMASAAAFLASDDSSYITGETLVVAGGMPSRL
ncbi:hypothetical protein B296_00049442 [Ensete ventricosum]|uniref:Glucose 1-dehydrogenase n=1 Tax=Ensete ventricosum TaxID=4639 RepID=A0A426XCZ5_ENSVE|nr:hypothetical protein B296_00049442 [Ensete ventricosum]